MLFLPIAVYTVKTKTNTESDASSPCKANIYVTPNRERVEFFQTNKTTSYYVYVTQTKDKNCTYNLELSTPRGVSASIQKQITPDAHSTKQASLRVSHNNFVKPGWQDIYIKVVRASTGDGSWSPDAVGHVTYIVNPPQESGDR